VRELTALWIFLARFLPPSTRQTSILWRIDNTTALAHIRKEGGLRVRALIEGAERILLLAHQRLLPAFISSEENLQADAASRFHLVPDWHLAPTVFHQMSTLWGLPQIDLFASRQSAQTQRFYSWRAADAPEAIDALSLRWDFALAFSLLFPFSRGLFGSWSCPGGRFFSSPLIGKLSLQVEDVRCLLFSDDLIIDLTTGEPHPNLERLFLVVWKILGGLGESTPSRTGPSGLFRQDGSDPQKTATKELGSISRPSSALPPFHSIRRL
jgi:hypothetical protein